MEKIINRLIIDAVEGCDVYHHNKSTWLIFTDTKQWVVELTGGGTLWYNYNFFHNLFKYVSLDVMDNQQYITKWGEDNVINKTQVNLTKNKMSDFVSDSLIRDGSIDSVRVNEYSLNYVSKQRDCEDTIENGVKHTESMVTNLLVNAALENGVKETRLEMNITEGEVDDIIQDGVKHTARNNACADWEIEDTIQNGVKETIELMNELPNRVKKIIKKGVKHTEDGDWLDGDVRLDDIIENGVKKTKEMDEWVNTPRIVGDVIKNGVRDTQSNPYENESWIEGVIKKGVKKTLWISAEREKLVETTLNNGVKETNHVDVMGFFNNKMEDALQNGVKEIYEYKGLRPDVKDVIQDGVKEVQPLPDQSGEIIGYGNYYHGKEDRTKAFIDYLEETIKFGVKEVYWLPKEHKQIDIDVNPIDDVINNGVKKILKGGIVQLAKINETIENGVNEGTLI
jgi:hypothetical protein